MDGDERTRAALRWRLVLGRHAERPLPLAAGAGTDPQRLDRALGWLYDREHAARQHRWGGSGGADDLSVPAWLHEVRGLFPQETVRIVERDALGRFGLQELVTDPQILARLEPTEDLLRALLSFRDALGPAVLPEAKRVVRRILAELVRKLRLAMEPHLRGRRRGPRGRPPRTFRNVHWHRTIRRNLSRWDGERLAPDRISFHPASRDQSPWHVVVAVDCSGSMLDSVIHASVTAAILTGLPALRVSLLAFDHRVVDLTELAQDPLEVLFRVQLGGGTLLLPALQAARERVTVPRRTVVALVSDLFVGDALAPSLAVAQELHDAGVRCLALCALDRDAKPAFDGPTASALAEAGWWVGALTPARFAEHLARVLRS